MAKVLCSRCVYGFGVAGVVEWPGSCGLVRLETGEMARLVEPRELVVGGLPIVMRAYGY